MDYDILRQLENEGDDELVLTPRTIAVSTSWSRSGVDSTSFLMTMEELHSAGLSFEKYS